jgi:hypothetical protein
LANKISKTKVIIEKNNGLKRDKKMSEFTYMKAPSDDHDFDVGDVVEVYCDHEKGGQRIRGWMKGIVVQVDSKMVAVQFRTNVYLTDGWMVPDHILWYPQNSAHIRLPIKRSAKSPDKIEF